MESWRLVLTRVNMRVKLEDVYVVASDSMGIVTCTECFDLENQRGRIAATNVFEKQGGTWKLIHHQGGPAPRI